MKTPQFSKKESSLQKPVQSKGKHIFVYIRRSTRNKQELSLQRQDDNAKETILQAWYDPNEVEYYIESMTAYNGVKVENGIVSRRRTEFTRMLSDIDNSPIPVVLLTYEDSRLSRNDPDTAEILARLFWEYEKNKRNIEKIVFNGGEIWDGKSDKWTVKQRLLDRYKESDTIWKRSSKATLRELRRGRYILSTPVGINRLKWETKEEKAIWIITGLEINEKMPFILRAWEMKADWKSKIEINRYLAKNSIKIWNTFEQYFKTYVYMGYYPDPETGELLKMKFAQWKAPIPEKLWYEVQETLWVRRVSKYGDKQKDDIISYLMKWEQDTKKAYSFTAEYPKWKYISFKSNALGGFNKSEIKTIQECLPQIIWKLSDIFYHLSWADLLIERNRMAKKNEIRMVNGLCVISIPKTKKEIELERLNKKERLLCGDILWNEKKELEKDYAEIESRPMGWPEYLKKRKLDIRKREIESIEEAKKRAEKSIKDSLRTLWNKESFIEQEEKELELEKFQKIKEEKEKEKSEIPLKYAKLNYPADIAQMAISEIDREITSIDLEITKLSESTDIEQFLDRIPEVLIKIFELCRKVLSSKEIKDMKDEIYKLIEITTFELSVSTKKELTVKLFEGLEDVLKLKNKIWLPELDSNQWPTG